MSKYVFFYWTGKSYKLIELLRSLIFLHSKNGINFSPIFLTDNNINDWITDIPKNFDSLIPAYKADFIRVAALNKYGGIWVDSDTLIMNSLADLFRLLNNQDSFFVIEDEKRICNGIFGSHKNTPLLNSWEEFIRKTIHDKINISWGELGNYFLTKTYLQNRNLFGSTVLLNGKKNIYPINFDKYEIWLSKTEHTSIVEKEFQPLIILVNKVYKAIESSPEMYNGSLLEKMIFKSISNYINSQVIQ